ncbi:30734_t:CDS:2, partial [Gigaspora margarita]
MSYKDLLEKFDFGQKFEYASFENKEEISKGKFGAIFKVDLKDIKQTVALKTLYHYDEKSLDNLIRNVKYTTEVNHDNIIQFIGITQGIKHVIEGDRETPIDGTPVGFKDLYCAAWDGIPNHRPKIEEICKKLDRVGLERIYKDLFDKNAFGKNFEYATFENKTEISKGEFGVIYKAHLSIKDENQIVALKTLGHDDERIFYDFVRE